MKYLIFLLSQLLVFQSFVVLSQEIKPLKPFVTTKYNDIIPNLIEIGDNQFLYSTNKLPFGGNPDHILYHEIEGQFSTVILTDLNHKVSKEYAIISPNDYTFRVIDRLIYDEENNRIIVVGVQNSLADRMKLFTIILNTDLEVIQEFTSFGQSDNIDFINQTIINKNNNIVAIGTYNSTNKPTNFIVEYTLTGELIHLTNYEVENYINSLMELDNNPSEYLVIGLFATIAKFDKNLTLIDRETTIGLNPSNQYKKLNDTIHLLSGLTYHSEINNPNFESHTIWQFDKNGNPEVFYDDFLPTKPTLQRGYRSLDFVDNDFIYFANNSDVTGFFFEYANTNSYISLYSLKSDGTLNWQQTIGGEANYYVWQVLATQDKGCLVLANRYSDQDNEEDYDVYYMKLDKDGNIEEEDLFDNITSVVETPPTPSLQLTASPSPFQQQTKLTFTLPQNSTVSLHIHNQLGQKVATLHNNNQLPAGQHHSELRLDDAANGIYYAVLSLDGQKVVSQKVVLMK